jgi:transposase
MRYIKGTDRDQVILFPEVIDDYITEENAVRFIDAFVESLDLKELGFKHAELNPTGRPPYNPSDLLKLYIYGYLNRVRSSRFLEKECKKNVEVMWLLKKLTPDFKTIADFRKDNKDAIKKIFKEFVILCKKLDLFGGELVAIDGSKFKAVNSKKRNFNEATLQKKLKDIDEKIEAYFKELEINDNSEATISSDDARGLKNKIEILKDRKEEYQELLKKLKESGKSQISLTDPDSRKMLSNQAMEICYNVQVTVDEKNKLILDYEVTNENDDSSHLSEMSERAKQILEVDKLEVLADANYYEAEEIKKCVDNGIIPYIPERNNEVRKDIDPSFYKSKFRYNKEKDIYICPAGNELRFFGAYSARMERLYRSDKCDNCQLRSRCTSNKRGRILTRWEHEDVLDDMRKRIKENKDKVKKRKELAEHPFGTIKRAFNQGYMLLKRLPKVGTEASLTMLAYDITRVINIVGVKKLMDEVTTVGDFSLLTSRLAT